MSRRVTTRVVRLKDALDVLGCSKTTFKRKWLEVFTDARPPEDRRERCGRKVFEDELSVAVEDGSDAVLTFRRLMGRLK